MNPTGSSMTVTDTCSSFFTIYASNSGWTYAPGYAEKSFSAYSETYVYYPNEAYMR
jgi:hypothetical protein